MGNHKYNLLKSFKRFFLIEKCEKTNIDTYMCITESVKLCNYEINWRCINKH